MAFHAKQIISETYKTSKEMADYVANEELQKEEESSIFSLANLWTIVVLNWQWILLSTFIALSLAFLYLRYTSPVFSSAMKVLIKDEEGRNRSMSGQMNLESMGIDGDAHNCSNIHNANRNISIARNRKIRAL